MKSLFKNCIFAMIPLIVLVALLEIGLRLAGFYYSDTPLMMASLKDNPTGVVDSVIRYNNEIISVPMVKDPKQLWVPVHSFEERYSREKPAGTVRIAALGDSCTMGCTNTSDSYPGIMEKLLNEKLNKKYEVLNAGVGSHSSYQGLQRFRYSVLPFKPDIVTVYFGWNDHWITSVPDKDVKIKSEFQVALLNFFERFRSYQAYHYLIAKLLHAERKAPAQVQEGDKSSYDWIKLRVAPDDYMRNLVDFVKTASENNIRILLVTAPSDPARLSPNSNFPFPKDHLIHIHAQYNEIVREVARRLNVPLLDLAANIQGELAAQVFSDDAVHFSPEGCTYIAVRFIEALDKLGWL